MGIPDQLEYNFFSLLENIITYKNKLWQKLVLDMENIQKLFHFCYKSQTIFFAMNIKIVLIPIFFYKHLSLLSLVFGCPSFKINA